MILAKVTGILGVDQIQSWFESIKGQPVIYLMALAAFLLCLDLVMAVPTLTICLFSGHFIGFGNGFVACLLGTSSAGVIGYCISRRHGPKIISMLLKSKEEQQNMKEAFATHSTIMILLSRALPVLPEISACLSGMTKMSPIRFLLLWHVSSIPYILLATYAGSVSTIENPKPAIFTAIGIILFFWLAWFFFTQGKKKLTKIKDVK
jgi:uncharacterized membrane protein YdjX (TVP38/TMEM64 family)